jgi:CrcB protein
VTYLYVALGAVFGAPLRYVVHRFVEGRHENWLPWGTFAVNVVGSLVVGVLVGSQPFASGLSAALVVGFCGSFTTYSALAYDTVHLLREGLPARAVGYLLLTVVAGTAAAAGGWWVGRSLS